MSVPAHVRTLLLFFGLTAVLFLSAATDADAQSSPIVERRPYVQTGLGVIPGLGVQVGYVGPRRFYSREVTLFVEYSPPFAEGEGSVEVAAGLGASIRVLETWRVISGSAYNNYDIDVGLRLVPGLSFALNESREAKNRRFNLSPDLFVRVTTPLSSGRIVFAELGVERPKLRAGLWFTF